ncbi:DNA polymerase III, gamma/tau subunit [Candidatus Liberibacter americanus str. Sao Paulo]|uniref:DNA polymerase III subunit gamma/tau n=1 Tax=Candidatus Liberibacter americanus str. Sao Paulo TaxID=1261131 RepID=U6B741_9HYPH|nr:DNA polymerase III, gamma/tau subunit [Candidatus Liberibacter americanus str. Sao Paulo]EMS36472.1 DNA polymerase III subunits gamma and tau [Candidatus Liberibacter americanus PW_SP]
MAKLVDNYHILARKYRPHSFDDMMVGQDAMIKTLTNAFKSGRIAQAYMLSGIRGVGKTTTARIIARSLNYKTDSIDFPTVEFKGLGYHCQSILQGNHIDVIELDAASHTGIDDIREIIEQMCYKPISARYKVYIIDEVHMLSTSAFNALLKTLEEPPPNVKFIFATTEIRKVPITVLSRCQRFDLDRISIENLIGLFKKVMKKESIGYDNEAIAMIARASDGSVRDGLSLLDQAIARGDGRVEVASVKLMLSIADKNQIIDLFGYLIKGNIVGALHVFSAQYDSGINPSVVLHDLADFTHLVTRIKYLPEMVNSSLYSETENLRASEYAKDISITFLSRFWQMILKGISEIDSFPRTAEAVEMVLIRLAHASQLPSPESIARYILKDKQQKTRNYIDSSTDLLPKSTSEYDSSQDNFESKGLSYSKSNETILKKKNLI